MCTRLPRAIAPLCRRRHVFEAGPDGLAHLRGLDVPRDDDEELAGHVPALEEGPHPGAVEGRHALGGAEDRGTVRVAPVHLGEDRVAEHVVWAVLGAADLLEHHLHLAADLLGLEQRVLHGIREDVERQLGSVARDGGVIGGDVEARVGVDVSTRTLHLACHLSDRAP